MLSRTELISTYSAQSNPASKDLFFDDNVLTRKRTGMAIKGDAQQSDRFYRMTALNRRPHSYPPFW